MLCSSRRLAHYRVGQGRGIIRISEAQLQEYLESSQVGVREVKKDPREPVLQEPPEVLEVLRRYSRHRTDGRSKRG